MLIARSKSPRSDSARPAAGSPPSSSAAATARSPWTTRRPISTRSARARSRCPMRSASTSGRGLRGSGQRRRLRPRVHRGARREDPRRGRGARRGRRRRRARSGARRGHRLVRARAARAARRSGDSDRRAHDAAAPLRERHHQGERAAAPCAISPRPRYGWVMIDNERLAGCTTTSRSAPTSRRSTARSSSRSTCGTG